MEMPQVASPAWSFKMAVVDVTEITSGNNVVLQVNGGGTITVVNGVFDNFDLTTDVFFV